MPFVICGKGGAGCFKFTHILQSWNSCHLPCPGELITYRRTCRFHAFPRSCLALGIPKSRAHVFTKLSPNAPSSEYVLCRVRGTGYKNLSFIIME